MSKADFKKVVAKYSPQCIEALGSPDSSIESFPVVIQDLPCDLSAVFGTLAKQESSFTLDEIIRRVFAPAVAAVASSVQLWIAVQDKASLVTSAKQPEWHKRSLAKSSASNSSNSTKSLNIKPLVLQDKACLVDLIAAQAAVPRSGEQWYALFNHADRQNKNFLVRQLTTRAKTLVPEMMAQKHVPPHHRIVLDCETFPFLEGSDSDIVQHGVEAAIYPLSSGFATHMSPRESEFDLLLRSQLLNSLGEFDVSFLHHLQAPIVREIIDATPQSGVLIETVDTDILVIAALREDAISVPVRIKLSLPRNIQVPGVTANDEAGHSSKVLFDPSMTREWLCTTMRDKSQVDNPTDLKLMQNFCLVYIMGGSDFCHDSIPNVSSETLVTDYLLSGGDPIKFLEDKLMHSVEVLTGRVNKSRSARTATQLMRGERLQRGGLKSSVAFAKYIANDYWTNSAHTERIVGLPVGHGTALKAGSLVFAADLTK